MYANARNKIETHVAEGDFDSDGLQRVSSQAARGGLDIRG
jgi:hypothetical protein